MAATTFFYWIIKGNKKVIIEAGKKAADALRKGGATRATKKEVADMPARRQRLTQGEAEKLYPPKPRKSPPKQPTKTLSPEAQAQADRLRDLSQQAGVPITSEAQAKAFEAFAKGGTRKWWNSVSPKKKATMAAAAGFATVGGFYAWLSTGKGKPDFAAVRRVEERAKRKALPGLSLTREQALLREPLPAKTNGEPVKSRAAPKRRVVSRGTISNGITRYNSGSFNAAYAKERAKAMKAGEPDTGEFYWKGDKYTTRIKSKKPPKKEIKHAEEFVGTGSKGTVAPKHILKDVPPKKAEKPDSREEGRLVNVGADPDVSGLYEHREYPDLMSSSVRKKLANLLAPAGPDDEFVGMNKKGGQVKKSLKKAKARKRAALRGHRAELRGG